MQINTFLTDGMSAKPLELIINYPVQLLQQKGPDWVVGEKPGIIRYCGHEPGDGKVIENLWTNDQGHL